jgi:ribonuclease Z
VNITGYSTALFATWYFYAEARILFDCGDGVSSVLLQKARKIKHVFLSHADRDHLTGLLQFHQLNARPGLRIYYPADCGSIPALAAFFERFDPHVSGAQWIPVRDGEEVMIRENLCVRAFRNRHVPAENGEDKSLSYAVESIARKLKPEFIGKAGSEIAAACRELGDEAVSDLSRSIELIYSGDTPIETDGRYDGCDPLIHEATFLTSAEIDPDNPRRNKHSSLEQVIAVVAASDVKRLILGHFSSRYDYRQIEEAIQKECGKHGLTIPVFRVLPGKIVRDVLNSAKLSKKALSLAEERLFMAMCG